MKLLSYFAEHHPLPTTIGFSAVGASGLAVEWLNIHAIDTATHLVSLLAAGFSLATAITGTVVMLRRARADRREAKRWKRMEPAEEHLRSDEVDDDIPF